MNCWPSTARRVIRGRRPHGVKEAFEALGFAAKITTKGGVLADLGGADKDDALFLQAHTDTLGAMVAEIKANGRLKLTPLGGLRAENAETENVRIHTRTGKSLRARCSCCNASVHVNGEYGETKRTFDTVEAVLDEDVKTAEDTRALGIEVGGHRLPRAAHEDHFVRLHQKPLFGRQALRRRAAGARKIPP